MNALAKTKTWVWLTLSWIHQKLVPLCQNPFKYVTIYCSNFGLSSANRNHYFGLSLMSGWEKCSQGHDKLELSNQYIHFMPLIFIFSTWNQLELIQLYGSKCWFTCLVSALIWSWELKQTHFKVRLRIEKSWWSIQFFTHIHLCMHHPENQILNFKRWGPAQKISRWLLSIQMCELLLL